MKLIIDIPEDLYAKCRKYGLYCGEAEFLEGAVAKGTLLQKGHGRLIDADELKIYFPCGEYVRTECVRATIDYAPTIIEAESEE